MHSIGLIVLTLVSVVYGGRYKAPDPSEVNFPYRKIPTMTELISDAGFEHEPHRVTTEDGHILALHRISPRGATSWNRGYPVLIINGFSFQSDGWLALGSSSLPFILTDLGYDVWLGDQRGSARSLEHETYPVDDWRNHNYTFHEQGIYDLPAFIDYILKETDRNQLLYVGYSLSGGMLIVMNSERPEYNDKLLGAVLLAPAGHLKKWEENPPEYLAGLTVLDSAIESQIKNRLWLLFGNLKLVKDTIAGCSFSMLNSVCRLAVFNMYGVSEGIDPKTLFYQYAMTSTSVSVYVGKHLLQVIKHGEPKVLLPFGALGPGDVQFSGSIKVPLVRSWNCASTINPAIFFGVKAGRFCKYDHGPTKNLQVYGNESPPDYDFSRTRIPIYLFLSGADKMVTPDAAVRSGRGLGNLVKRKYIKRFNHADYIFAKSAPKMVYQDIVEYFDELVTTTLE